MRISDWSSDVCSSDLQHVALDSPIDARDREVRIYFGSFELEQYARISNSLLHFSILTHSLIKRCATRVSLYVLNVPTSPGRRFLHRQRFLISEPHARTTRCTLENPHASHKHKSIESTA